MGKYSNRGPGGLKDWGEGLEGYEELLDRALEQVPMVVSDRGRLKLPEVDAIVVGNRTIFRNFRSFASALNREPGHLMKYLLRELGVAGNLEGSQAVFQGKFPGATISGRIERYTEEFVFCRECKRFDTKLIKHGRIQMIKCEACGARASVRSI